MQDTADGRLLASGGLDGTNRLWDTSSGVALRTFRSDRRYERVDITGLSGITQTPRSSRSVRSTASRSHVIQARLCGYTAVLIRLERFTVPALDEIIVEAWLARAPKRLVEASLSGR